MDGSYNEYVRRVVLLPLGSASPVAPRVVLSEDGFLFSFSHSADPDPGQEGGLFQHPGSLWF